MIAEKVGFSDYTYFIRVFSTYIGDTPGAFLRKLMIIDRDGFPT